MIIGPSARSSVTIWKPEAIGKTGTVGDYSTVAELAEIENHFAVGARSTAGAASGFSPTST